MAFKIVFPYQNINSIELYMHPCFYFPTGRYLNNSCDPRTESFCCECKLFREIPCVGTYVSEILTHESDNLYRKGKNENFRR